MPRPDVPDPSFDDPELLAAARSSSLRGLVAYEDRAVRHVLKRLGLARLAPEIARTVNDRTGALKCTFAAFGEFVPDFPVHLAVGRVRNVRFLSLPTVFDRFPKTAMYAGLSAMIGERPDAAYHGLVFPFKGDAENPGPKGGTFAVLHTYTPSLAVDGPTRIVCDAPPHRVVMEMLDGLLMSFPAGLYNP